MFQHLCSNHPMSSPVNSTFSEEPSGTQPESESSDHTTTPASTYKLRTMSTEESTNLPVIGNAASGIVTYFILSSMLTCKMRWAFDYIMDSVCETEQVYVETVQIMWRCWRLSVGTSAEERARSNKMSASLGEVRRRTRRLKGYDVRILLDDHHMLPRVPCLKLSDRGCRVWWLRLRRLIKVMSCEENQISTAELSSMAPEKPTF